MPIDDLLVVTTRSKLRGVRFLPSMLNATLSIRRQLDEADGVVRWASVIASPTEFWTISAWDSRHHMQEFMRSDAHGRWMWEFSHWLSSFWLMRWRPGRRELGRWDGLAVTDAGERSDRPEPDPDAPAEVLDGLRRNIPALFEALGTDGVVSFDRNPDARRARRYVSGAGGAIVRIRSTTVGLPRLMAELHGVRRDLQEDDGLVGCAVGLGRRREAFLLGVWRDHRGAAELLDSAWAHQARARFDDRFWACDWRPESEFGHWDGRRLRRDHRIRTGPGSYVP